MAKRINGRSQRDIAEAIGKGEAYVSKIFNGNRKLASVKTLRDIAQYLDITLDELDRLINKLEIIR
jgi:transcriptional regulator with XRE-family HTH domain